MPNDPWGRSAYKSPGFGSGGFVSGGTGPEGYAKGGFASQYGSEYTESQQELFPYIEEQKQAEEKEKLKLRPLQMAFDLLSRGQYFTANLASEIITSLQDDDSVTKNLRDVFVAGVEGITGKRKGSWKDVLYDFTDLEEVQLWKVDKKDEAGNIVKRAEDRFLGDVNLADVLGLAGDIFLDPLNALSLGSTGAARAAARSYANDAVKVAFKTMGIDLASGTGDDLVRIASRKFDPRKFDALRKESMEKAVKYFDKNMGGDVSRAMNTTWKRSFEDALVSTPEKLRSDIGEGLSQVSEFTDDVNAGIINKMFTKQQAGKMSEIDLITKTEDVLGRPSTLEKLEKEYLTSYSTAGETRLLNILGKDFGVKTEGFAQDVLKQQQILKQYLGDTKIGRTLSDAYWSVTQNGKIGEIKRAMGVRTPYEKLIRQVELEEGNAFFQKAVRDNVSAVDDALMGADEALMEKYVGAIDIAESASTKKSRKTVFQILEDPDSQKLLGITPEELAPINELATNIQNLTRDWKLQYDEMQPYVSNMGFMENYLPAGYRRTSLKSGTAGKVAGSKPGFAQRRGFTRRQGISQEEAKLRWILKDTNVSEQELSQMVRGLKVGNVEMDLRTLLYTRAQGQAGIQKRYNLMESLKNFGLDMRNIKGKGALGQAVRRSGASISELGLKKLDTKGFETMMFDTTVGDVFGRLTKSLSDEHLPGVKQAMRKYMNWWKGIATMTPGFHARNFLSNNTTGFMRHGVKWFSPAKDGDALAATIHAMHSNKLDEVLEGLGMKKSWLDKTLAKEVSPGRTLMQVADDAKNSRLISDAQMGFGAKNAAEMSQKMTGNPFSQEFFGTRASRAVGGVIENQSKMKSYLLSYEEVLGKLGDNPKLAQEAHVFAELDSKKWFLDYEDLTEFEQGYMKQVMPFYTWMRKNLGNQIEGILMYPQMYSLFPKLKEFATLDDPEFDESLLPEWMDNEVMFPTSKTDGVYNMLRADVPVADLNLLPFTFQEGKFMPKLDFTELKDELVNSTNPIIKQVASLLTEKGYDFFRKEELGETAPAPYAVQLLIQNPETVEWLDNVMKGIGFDGLDAKVENGKLEMDARLMQSINLFFPLIKQINYAIHTGTALVPKMQEAIEESTGLDDRYEGLEKFFQLMSFWTGIKSYMFNQEDKEFGRQQGIYYSARDRRTADMAQDPDRMRRNMTARDRQDDLIRRMVGN